jgi:hypothetical protein
MKLFQKPKGTWYASSKDQSGRTRYVSLRTTDRDVAEEITDELVYPESSCMFANRLRKNRNEPVNRLPAKRSRGAENQLPRKN